MKEKLIIKNFGPIKHVELELGKINVLIGEQGTGKSTIGKIVAIFRNEAFLQDLNFKELLEQYNIDSYLKKESLIKYSCKEFTFNFDGEQHKLEILSEDLRHLINNIKLTRDKWFSTSETDSSYSLLLDEIIRLKSEFNKISYISKYTPSERTLIGSDDSISIEKHTEQKYNFSYLTEFNASFRRAKVLKEIHFLDWRFKPEDRHWHLLNKDLKVRLKNASSGIQSIFPILLTYSVNYILYDKVFHIVEEPEQNLFPTTQYEMLKYLTLDLNNRNHRKLLTTHSPYILTSLNNLMYAWQIGQDHGVEADKIIPKKYWVNPLDVSAYMLQYDETLGGCIQKDIIDKETLLIDSVQIDGVSDILSEEFNRLMALKMGVEI